MSSNLTAGTAEIEITPRPGCDLIHRQAESIHDSLWARTLAFAADGKRVALVGLDLIALSREQIALIRQRVRQRCGLQPAELLLCCSHTHSGPVTNYYRGWGHADPAYITGLIDKVAGCVETALQRLTPCRLSYGEAPFQAGFNRRLDHADGTAHMIPNPAGPVDTTVRVLCVTDTDSGKLKGLLFSHGCHAVVLHISSKQVTSDYPGRAAEFLKAELGADVCPMFAQGCGGDANSEVLNGTFADRDRIGVQMGQAVLAAMKTTVPLTVAGLRTALTVLPLPVRIPTPAEATAALAMEEQNMEDLRQAGASAETLAEFQDCGVNWAKDLCRIAAGELLERVEIEISAISFGPDFGLVGLGAEPFFGYQAVCRAVSPWSRTLVLGYVNGPTCYLPTANEFVRKGYETAGVGYADRSVYNYGFAYKRYGTLALTSECEDAVRRAVGQLLAVL